MATKYTQEEDKPKGQGKLILIGIAMVIALALAIYSGVRSLDTSPKVTGVLGGDQPGAKAPVATDPAATSDTAPSRKDQ